MKSLRHSGGFSTNRNLESTSLQRLYLEEDNDEGEQSQRLDERETKNQEGEDSRTSARVTRQSLSSRGSRLTLTKSAETSRQGHAQTGSHRNPLVDHAGLSSLCKGRRCKQQRGQRHKQILQLLHCYSISRQIRRQWVVDAHRAGTLTLAALLPLRRGSPFATNSNQAKLSLVRQRSINAHAPLPARGRLRPAGRTQTPARQQRQGAAP